MKTLAALLLIALSTAACGNEFQEEQDRERATIRVSRGSYSLAVVHDETAGAMAASRRNFTAWLARITAHHASRRETGGPS